MLMLKIEDHFAEMDNEIRFKEKMQNGYFDNILMNQNKIKKTFTKIQALRKMNHKNFVKGKKSEKKKKESSES